MLKINPVTADDFKRAAPYTKQADGLMVAAGAGMGVDSELLERFTAIGEHL